MATKTVPEKTATARRHAPKSDRVRVKILPKDPLVAKRDGLWPVEVDIACLEARDGPCGPRAVVVDYNADLDVRFAPAQIQGNRSFKRIAALSKQKLLDDFNFHQVNVWGIVERTLALIEDDNLLGRPVPWANGRGRLILMPHAGYDQNAFYDRATGALHFFYFEGPDGAPVYTCLSHDIVTHELGHAVLDGLKPGYNEVSSAETAGFHEYFGDAVAMMASLATRETALVVLKDRQDRLEARNVVSAIASEFGAALRGIPDEAYLRGAWNKRTMRDLAGKYEEHDWSEILTGVYYDLLQFLYRQARKDLATEHGKAELAAKPLHYGMRALSRAASQTAGVMFRGLDYCPPVDLRYGEYARAVLRAQAVAYPGDRLGVYDHLKKLFAERGIVLPTESRDQRQKIQLALREVDVSDVASTPADAYRFLDANRDLFGIPYPANINVCALYRTKKGAKSGYRPPREHVMEFTWSEDVLLTGAHFGALDNTRLPLWCGGTLVFDVSGNFLHLSLVLPTDKRKNELREYAGYLAKNGALAVGPGVSGIGAPGTGDAKIRATVERGRTTLSRIAAMHHHAGHGVHE